tara:strand:+ start:1262 stop:2023 length:762 start_codon:yes stop_codon:yes gene_type:complete
MQKSIIIDYNKMFNEQGFVHVKNYISKDLCMYLNEVIFNIIQTHKCIDGSNPYVTNINRQALTIYSNQYNKNSNNSSYLDRKKKEYQYVEHTIINSLASLMDNFFHILKIQRWTIIGITVFICPSGCKEQEIHHDAPPDKNRFFITIPLHDTSINMGPTIFYNNKYLKNFKRTYKPMEKPPIPNQNKKIENGYGVVGFLNDNIPYKDEFRTARVQKSLKLGDIQVHRDITFHSGGNNNSNKERRLLFFVIDVN